MVNTYCIAIFLPFCTQFATAHIASYILYKVYLLHLNKLPRASWLKLKDQVFSSHFSYIVIKNTGCLIVKRVILNGSEG